MARESMDSLAVLEIRAALAFMAAEAMLSSHCTGGSGRADMGVGDHGVCPRCNTRRRKQASYTSIKYPPFLRLLASRALVPRVMSKSQWSGGEAKRHGWNPEIDFFFLRSVQRRVFSRRDDPSSLT